MELKRVDPASGDNFSHHFLWRVREHADLGDQRRQLANDLGGGWNRNMTRACFAKDEAQGIGSGIDRGEGVFQVRNSADFYS